MIATVTDTFGQVAGGVALAALLLPVALFAGRRATGRRDTAQVATGIAAVAALLVPAGLVLSLVGGLTAVGWLSVVGAASAIALVWSGDRRQLARRAIPATLAAAALGLTVGALALSRAGAADQARETRFTQLWLVPGASGLTARVGVRNEERAASTFRVRVIGPAPRGSRTLLERTVRLDRSATWTASLELPPTAAAERVTASLYRPGSAAPYRSVHVWTRPGG